MSLRERLLTWWRTGLAPDVKFTLLVLVANGLPALVILHAIPDRTADWFVWTVEPVASARLLGVMYANALLLVAYGFTRRTWPDVRVVVVLVAYFSVAATLVTFVHLDPFLKHPWYHLTYWLAMYLILFVVAPVVLVRHERREGGRLPVQVPLGIAGIVVAIAVVAVTAVVGVALLVAPAAVAGVWPWKLTPLVGRLIGVWITSLAVAHAWALWDGDWGRTKGLFYQAIPTGLLLAAVPLLHAGDMGASTASLGVYLGLSLGWAAAAAIVVVLRRRPAVPRHG